MVRNVIISVVAFVFISVFIGCAADSPTTTVSPTPTVSSCDETAGTLTTIRIPDDGEEEHETRKTRIYLPPCYGQPTQTYPVLYLLHGAGLSGTTWFDQLDTADIMDRQIAASAITPFIIVAPTFRTHPTDEAWFVEHLVPTVDDLYQTNDDRLYRGIAGMSMGGGLSGRIGWKNPEMFGAMGLYAMTKPVEMETEFPLLLNGLPPDLSQHIYLDVGDSDGLLGISEQVVRHLEEAEIAHTYIVGAGGHTLGYWQENMERYLDWFDAVWDVPAD